MGKTGYYIVQILWSFVLSAIVWYLALVNASFDFYGNSDDTLMMFFLLGGGALYLILTVVQIVVGFKKVKNWHWWDALISLVVSVVVAFAGLFGAVYGSEFINGLLPK